MNKSLGFTLPLSEFDKAKFKAGGINKHTPKTIYLEFSSKMTCLKPNLKKSMRSFLFDMRKRMNELTKEGAFYNKYIFLHNIADSFANTGKTFVVTECILYPKKGYDSKMINQEIDWMCSEIYDNVIMTNKDFQFEKNRDRWTILEEAKKRKNA